ncbi:glycosyltransferase family 4 protein [Rhizobium viscosum]|uniref:Glycosyltransferase involved in cell wall biosynthesis n=1 Tax=Rhizobium viscosum TaxID=1673 RepID=A0ABR9IZF2_RHIVS|nr:glycosyltransferase [Rhizobium viscosum]MBE1508574.1 glycosyltransferase involved in cell wall biosynthesis [Rhizobium viscosum]
MISSQVDIRSGGHAQALRLVYVVTEDWFFVAHFLPLARAARKAGFEIVVVTRVTAHGKEIEAEGFRIVPLVADRASFGVVKLLSTVIRLRSILAAESPTVVHAIALKSIILSGLAAIFVRKPGKVFSVTGLGYLWSDSRRFLGPFRLIVRQILQLISDGRKAIFTFENDDDCREFPKLKNRVVVGGWGINSSDIVPRLDRPQAPIRVVYLGRMLRAKGIELTVQAVELARKKADIQLELWGTPDPGNLTSLTEEELRDFSLRDGIKWCGRAGDIAETWHRADIAILLSEREGMPRSLIEAAAAAVPMVAFDVPGCRAIVRHELTGFLLPKDHVAAVADAILMLAQDDTLRERMGLEARNDFEQRFSTHSVVPKIMDLYFELVRHLKMQ